jgi:hypothetical protein
LISELADKIRHWEPQTWHRRTFLFEAFKIGVAELLKGIKSPELPPLPIDRWEEEFKKGGVWRQDLVDIFKSPRRMGGRAAKAVLADLYWGVMREGPLDRFLDAEDDEIRRFAKYDRAQRERTHYGMQDVSKDLGLERKAKGRG